MSQSNINNTVPSQTKDLDKENNNSTHTVTSSVDDTKKSIVSIASIASNNSDESPCSTEDNVLEARLPAPRPVSDEPQIISVLPRRRRGGLYREEILHSQHDHELEDLLSDGVEAYVEPQDSSSLVVIGRYHPDTSEAASAGYRYRIR